MIKRLWKDKPDDLNDVGQWEIQVIAVFHLKDNVVYRNVHEGKKWVAYLKVRFKALLKDWATRGEYYGIAWNIEKVEK